MRNPLFAIALCLASLPITGQTGGPAAPVLVELFTSEGCSSCPPADSLLERLDRLQPIPGVQIIVLSEHVDYWNQGGWVDPYSSAEFTARQQAYDTRLKGVEPYTPQMVVDGTRQCSGNDPAELQKAILEAARRPKMALQIAPGARPHSVTVEVAGPPAARPADVYVAIAQETVESNVARGENRGHTLHHVAVVRKLRKLGKSPEVSVSGFAGARLVAFLAEKATGKIVGVAMYRIPD